MVSRRRLLALTSTAVALSSGCLFGASDDSEEASNSTDRTMETATTEESTVESQEPAVEGGRVLDVRAFGAAVDGETDDTHAIRDALAEAGENDVVFFPPGETLVSGSGRYHEAAIHLNGDEVPKGLTIAGTGHDSVVKMADAQPRYYETFFLDVRGGFEDLTIRDLRLDGNKQGQGFPRGAGGHGIKTDDADSAAVPVDVRIENLWVEDYNMSGMKIRHGGIVVDGCTVRGCVKHGLAPDSSQDVGKVDPPIVIRNCHCVENGLEGAPVTYGIDCSGGNIVVEDTVCERNAQGTKTTGDGIDITYRRVRLEDNLHHGYLRAGTQAPNGRVHVTFEDVVAVGNGELGFRFGDRTDYDVPTEIVASRNAGTNALVTGDAKLRANRVWVNRSQEGYGLYCDSTRMGKIEKFYSFANARGGKKLQQELEIVKDVRREKHDVEGVPTALDVGAGPVEYAPIERDR